MWSRCGRAAGGTLFAANSGDLFIGDSLVDHSAFVYLMSRGGAYLTTFRAGGDPRAMARMIASYID